jgi:hypothetical protein
MTASDHDQVRENLLIEGLMDAISLGEVHGAYFGQDAAHAPPVPQVQKQTLDMIRELVSDGLFVLGPDQPGRVRGLGSPAGCGDGQDRRRLREELR